MSRNTKFHIAEGAYFVSFAVVVPIAIGRMDVFTRNEYKDILLASFSYSRQNKGMEVFVWGIMTNHIHLVFNSIGENIPENLLGDFKRFTSKKMIQAILDNPKESRKDWLPEQFKKAADQCSNVN